MGSWADFGEGQRRRRAFRDISDVKETVVPREVHAWAPKPSEVQLERQVGSKVSVHVWGRRRMAGFGVTPAICVSYKECEVQSQERGSSVQTV
jgi:hypothetical protein